MTATHRPTPTWFLLGCFRSSFAPLLRPFLSFVANLVLSPTPKTTLLPRFSPRGRLAGPGLGPSFATAHKHATLVPLGYTSAKLINFCSISNLHSCLCPFPNLTDCDTRIVVALETFLRRFFFDASLRAASSSSTPTTSPLPHWQYTLSNGSQRSPPLCLSRRTPHKTRRLVPTATYIVAAPRNSST